MQGVGSLTQAVLLLGDLKTTCWKTLRFISIGSFYLLALAGGGTGEHVERVGPIGDVMMDGIVVCVWVCVCVCLHDGWCGCSVDQ